MTYQASNPHSYFQPERRVIPFLRQSRTEFGSDEWCVVDMARHDGPRSLKPNGVSARMLRLFGVATKEPLPNRRLEALRRFSIRAWFCDYVRAKDVRGLLEAGFAWDDVWRILAHVAAQRGFMPSIDVGDLTAVELALKPLPTAL